MPAELNRRGQAVVTCCCTPRIASIRRSLQAYSFCRCWQQLLGFSAEKSVFDVDTIM
jgi:hypothetical protein